MSELFDRQVNAQKEKSIRGSRKLPQAHEKECDENEKTNKRKKNDMRVKMLLMRTQRTGENDLNKLRVNDS